jgi:SAM-dependent methyltransferase
MSKADQQKWDRRYTCRDSRMGDSPRPFLEGQASSLAAGGQALDLAAGEGQNSVFLAGLGYQVTAVDISQVGLDKARTRAELAGLTLDIHRVDLKIQPEFIKADAWDLIICFRYLQRDLSGWIEAGLKQGGRAILELPNTRTAERRNRPSRRRLIKEKELLTWFPGLTVEHFEEDWEDDIHLSRIVVKKPG